MRHFCWLAACLLTLLASGCPSALSPTKAPEKPAPVAESGGAEQPPGAPAAAPAAQPAAPQQSVFKREVPLVDRNKYLAEHPDAIEKDRNEIHATGYLQAVSQGYFAAASTATIANFEHDLELQKELNGGKWPSFEKYKEILDTHGVKLQGLRLNQVYAYDDQTGQMSVIELPEEKPAP